MPQLALSAVLICWLLSSSLWLYPHSLSYFNESIGGPLGGPKHLLGSNIDWGQDLRYLIWWLNAHRQQSHAGRLEFNALFNPLDACPELGEFLIDSDERPASWYAVSMNRLFGPTPSQLLFGGDSGALAIRKDSQPDVRIGGSILIFRRHSLTKPLTPQCVYERAIQ